MNNHDDDKWQCVNTYKKKDFSHFLLENTLAKNNVLRSKMMMQEKTKSNLFSDFESHLNVLVFV